MNIQTKISQKPITYEKAMNFLNNRVDDVKNGKKPWKHNGPLRII